MAISVLPYRDELGLRPGRLFIDGEWTEASDGGEWTHVNPATNEEVTTFAIGSAQDVDRAVRAARRAFEDGPWPRVKARERKRVLQPLVDLIYDHADELNRLQTLANAMPMSMSSAYGASAEICADVFDHNFGWIDKITGETFPPYTANGPDLQQLSLREPIGVVAQIIPWNAPLLQFANKVAPALAAGCTMVMKPSEYASLAPLRLARLIEELELPPGVFNLVPGSGAPTGEALVTHPLIDKVMFTGSRAVGEHIMAAAARGIKRVSLELGGKSPSIVFPDAPLEHAADTTMSRVSMGLSGQVCSSQTRALVDRAIYDEFLEAASRQVQAVRFGDPFDPATTSAPLINKGQLEKVLGFIDQGQQEGGRLMFGGDRPGGDLEAGNWVNPAVFADVDNRMRIAQEEIFGPVLSVIPFSGEEEAIRIANDSEYGLSAGVYTNDVARAMRVGRALRSGTVGVNAYAALPNAPFGGYKTSGIGREGGWGSIEEVTEVKTLMIAL